MLNIENEDVMNRNSIKIYQKKFQSFLRDISESIAGSDADYTAINLRKALLLLSIPMVLEMAMESVFTIVDIYFVSNLGDEAVSIVGLTESMLSILYAFGIGFAISATAIVSRRIGEKEPRKAANAAFQSILVASTISVAISIIGLLFSDKLLQLMGASETSIAQYGGYTKWMLGGNATIMFLFLFNGIFRGADRKSVV